MSNQHTAKASNNKNKLAKVEAPPQPVAAVAAGLVPLRPLQSVHQAIGDLPDASQECTGCTTLRRQITDLGNKVSSIVAAKSVADDLSEIRKMVAELSSRLDVVANSRTPTAAVEDTTRRLAKAEENVSNLFEMFRKVHGTIKISQL